MKRQYNKLVCVIIALFILISGMCLEVPQADSFFACVDNNSITSCISSSRGSFSQYEISSRETTGVHSETFVSNISRRPILRAIVRVSSILSLAEIFLLKTSDIQSVFDAVCVFETHYFTALLNYIHRQDGKK